MRFMGAAMPIIAEPSVVPASLPRRSLSVDDVLRMVRAGVLAEDERMELIEGELIATAPIGGPHMQAVNRLTEMLVLACHGKATVSVQNAIALRPRSMPQPDFVLFRPETLAKPEVPGAADALLVIEIADSSLATDRDVKAPLYARHGIREYWIVNLARKVVQVYRQPGPDGYREMFERSAGQSIAPLALPDVTIALDALFA
jgi:hypothetical protein